MSILHKMGVSIVERDEQNPYARGSGHLLLSIHVLCTPGKQSTFVHCHTWERPLMRVALEALLSSFWRAVFKSCRG